MNPRAEQTLHLVEPTLNGTAGHCHALVQALAQAVPPDWDLQIWAGRGLGTSWDGPGQLHAHFSRRWRRLQAYALYRRLLRQPGRVLVTTAMTTDLVLADWAAPGQMPPDKFFAFVHWLNVRPSKRELLQRLARRQPNLRILAPTDSVVQGFRDCGFAATQVPYPLGAGTPLAAPQATAFRHLLVAGGARLDKGFDRIVALVEALAARGLDWPITVQVSREDRHGADTALAACIDRLRASTYPGLRLCEDTLSAADYRRLFDGAIALQPYQPEDFADRVSGVTLDALGAGAPVVVPEGTWMARLVRRFDAGAVLAERTPDALIDAIAPLLADHAGYARRARAAAAVVQAEHSAGALIDQVLSSAPQTPRSPT